MQRCGLQILAAPHQTVRTLPQDFHRLFPGTGGALYGQATHGWMSAFSRPGATTPVPGLFLAGGSVHPGPGVPMAAMSGQQAAAALMASPGLTRRLPPAATSGGMSMH
jgi:1-hydroxycarotenoid 3,4-desaturase